MIGHPDLVKSGSGVALLWIFIYSSMIFKISSMIAVSPNGLKQLFIAFFTGLKYLRIEGSHPELLKCLEISHMDQNKY